MFGVASIFQRMSEIFSSQSPLSFFQRHNPAFLFPWLGLSLVEFTCSLYRLYCVICFTLLAILHTFQRFFFNRFFLLRIKNLRSWRSRNSLSNSISVSLCREYRLLNFTVVPTPQKKLSICYRRPGKHTKYM